MSDYAIGEARFDFGRVVGQTFALIGRNFPAFILLALIFVGLPRFALMYVQGALLVDKPDLAAWMPLVGGLISLVTTYILQGALTRASVDDLSKKGVSIGAALGDGLRYFFPLFIVALLVGLGTGIGLLFFIIPGLLLIVRWAVAAPAALIEREGPTHSIGRSAELTQGHRWAVFGLVLLYFAFFYVGMIGLGMALAAVAGVGSNAAGVMATDMSGYIYAGSTALAEMLMSLVATVGMASLYFELRRVKDGVGIDELAKVFD